jgi:hypothetical protein
MTPLSSHTLRTTALVGALLPPDEPEGHMLRSWLDSRRSGARSYIRATDSSGFAYPACGQSGAGPHHRDSRQVLRWQLRRFRDYWTKLSRRPRWAARRLMPRLSRSSARRPPPIRYGVRPESMALGYFNPELA